LPCLHLADDAAEEHASQTHHQDAKNLQVHTPSDLTHLHVAVMIYHIPFIICLLSPYASFRVVAKQ
jgi:hypothetical protein